MKISKPNPMTHHPFPPHIIGVDFIEGDTVIYNERDVSSIPATKLEISIVARGLKVAEDVAKKVLAQKLPDGWKCCKLVEIKHNEDELIDSNAPDIHSFYYFNVNTSESSWDHPLVSSHLKHKQVNLVLDRGEEHILDKVRFGYMD